MPSGLKTRRLGQNFLIDSVATAKIVSVANISRSEVVCEVGTGHGDLTRRLSERAARVVSFEVDKILAETARRSFASFSNVEIRNEDPFKTGFEPFDVFVSNLPYSRSRDAIEWLAQRQFNRAVVTLQSEFADKLTAKPGTPSFRAISAIASFCFHIEHLFQIGPGSFSPAPQVESSVVRLARIDSLDKQTIKSINLIFSSRNKLASAIGRRVGYDVSSTKRVFQLEPGEIVLLARKAVGNVPPSGR